MHDVTRQVCGLALAGVLVAAAPSCGGSPPPGDARPEDTTTTVDAAPPPSFDPAGPVTELEVEVVASHPHDDRAYTQGLVYAGVDRLYETTGRYGESSLREVVITTGEVERRVDLDDAYFGEGLALSDGRLVALTWREHTALVFDPSTFAQTGSFSYDTEGWGLCDDGGRLVMSDGSATLTFRDRSSFAVTGSVQVTLDGAPVTKLNELECVGGLVYANVYLTDQIVVIDPGTGTVVARANADDLLDESTKATLGADEVLNGIAYDPNRGTFYLTGKHWPTLFEARLVPSDADDSGGL